MPTKPEVLTRNAAKVIAALENRDYSQPELGPETGLNVIELTRAVNYLKSQRRIEHTNGLLHLRAADAPTPVEPSTDPIARLQDTLGAALTTLVENGVQLVPPEPTPIPTPAPAPAPEAPTDVVAPVREPDPIPVLSDIPYTPEEKAELNRVWDEILGPGPQAPDIDAVDALETPAPELAEMTPAATAVQHEVDLITEIIRLKGQHAADEFEKATLRAKLEQTKRALRYVAAAGRVNAALLAQALGASKAASAPAVVIEVPDLHWSDTNTLAYLRKGWPAMTLEERDDNAVRLLNEIVANERNNAWFALVRAVQRASEAKAVQV